MDGPRLFTTTTTAKHRYTKQSYLDHLGAQNRPPPRETKKDDHVACLFVSKVNVFDEKEVDGAMRRGN